MHWSMHRCMLMFLVKKCNSIYAQAPLHIHRDDARCQDDGANDSVLNAYEFTRIVHISTY